MKSTYCYTIAFSLLLSLVSAAAAPFSAKAAEGSGVSAASATASASGQPGLGNSVLERFRTYTGPRNPDELSALFSHPVTGLVRQQPLIALSDGRTATILAIKVAATGDSAPGFSVYGAKLVPPPRKQNDEWVFTAIPDKGVWHAVLMVNNNSVILEYPLVVAPPVSPETDLSEPGFINFLAADRLDSTSSERDLNRDGKYDYIDDYIFTANYLAHQSTTGNTLESRRQRALKRTLSAPNSAP